MDRSLPEQKLHQAVAQLLSVALTSSSWWSTFPSGGGGLQRGRILKSMGLKAGVPDIIVIDRGRSIWIELKAGKNKPTQVQNECHDALWMAGALVCVCRSVDEVITALTGFKVPMRLASGKAA